MASRFWVGGTASWDATAGTKWAATSGGAGGAAVPTIDDDVFFDAVSGAGVVTITAAAQARSLDTTGFTGTITGSSSLRVDQNLTLSSGVTFTYSGVISMTDGTGTATITTAGKTLGSLTLGGASSTAIFSLQDALVMTGTLTLTGGTFTTNNYNVTASSLSSSNSNTRTINLGSSTVTLSATSSSINFNTNSNLTFNAGTSTVVFSGAGSGILAGLATAGLASITFNNLSYTSTAAVTHQIAFPGVGPLTALVVNNITISAPSSAGVTQFTTSGVSVTINGTLSTTGTAGNRRVWFRSANYGIAQTFTINSAPSLTDADFRDIYVVGTAAPISGTRIGDLRGCRGITFDAPKTVYWNLAAGGNWSANAWAATSGGAVSTDNFPLAQDTAVIGNTGLNASAVVTTPSTDLLAVGTLDASGRTLAMTLSLSSTTYYGDFTLGSGVSLSASGASTFSGRSTQTITSAGKSFPSGINVDSYGGTVTLADALNIGSSTINVINGTFDTQNYSVTAASLASSNSNIRAIKLGSSTLTLSGSSGIFFSSPTLLAFDAGTSQITITATSPTFDGIGFTFYNVTFMSTVAGSQNTLTGGATFNNFTVSGPATQGLLSVMLNGSCTVTGTLSVTGTAPVRRVLFFSGTLGTQRDLTAGTLVASDCDFRDIRLLGAAMGTAPTRAGNCGGNGNITFPAPKTVYWNLAGSNSIVDVGWATTSGGTPDANNFPLAQDTAVVDNNSAGTQISQAVAISVPALDLSARTTAFTWLHNTAATYYGSLLLGSGITWSGAGAGITFSGRGVSTIASNGKQIGNAITVHCATGAVQLADALLLGTTSSLTVTSGTFDAVSYNVTVAAFASTSTAFLRTVKMGSGTWTLAGTGTVWNVSATNLNFYKGTADIVLSDNTTTSRTFNGGGLSYNKLTIGGATSNSTTTLSSTGETYAEIASTKTVAHTIGLSSLAITFGKWSITGTAGNVVSVTGSTNITIAGPRVTGVDYLAMGTTAVASTSPGEFYAGPNSTGTGVNVIKTAPPAPVTRYWVGGTGNWNTSTTNWSATSGGVGGASVPTSVDAVVFNAASSAAAYTVTIAATARCSTLTVAGPASGNVTINSNTSIPLVVHDAVSFASTGVVSTNMSGGIVLSGTGAGKTFTSNGVALTANTDVLQINGVGCEWSLGSAANLGVNAGVNVVNGSFSTANYALTAAYLRSSGTSTRALNLGASTITMSGSSNAVDFGSTETSRAALTFSAGTSQINIATGGVTFTGNNQTFYGVAFTGTTTGSVTINGANTFNNLSVSPATSASVKYVFCTANQTISGTLTLSAGADATMRTFVLSNIIGTTRTLTCNAVSATDADFRDITIAGAAAPVSGTRLGDCKGNSGITFPSPKTVYRRGALSSWGGSTSWAATDGGAPDATQFPLAQDTAIIPASAPASGGTINVDAAYNIGTIDMSARTSATVSLSCSQSPAIYGNWVNGTGTTLTGVGVLNFVGRGSQTITSAGRTFTQSFVVDTPGGSVTLQDAFACNYSGSSAFSLYSGTLDANGYSFSLTDGFSRFSATVLSTRVLAIGAGTWTMAGSGTAWSVTAAAGLTVTGTGTLSFTNASGKSFAGGSVNYAGVTLNQGGAGALTITGNNTFANISNSYKATGATNITLNTTTQTVSNFTASGEAGRVLTVQGTSATSPATLLFSGAGQAANVDYLAITGVRAYNTTDTWYAGSNSVNNGSLGWYFVAGASTAIAVFITESATGSTADVARGVFGMTVVELASPADAAASGAIYLGALTETASVSDVVAVINLYLAAVSESTTAADLAAASAAFATSIAELALPSDAVTTAKMMPVQIAETAQSSDTVGGGLRYLSSITEATTAVEIAAAAKAYTAAVLEATTASEVDAATALFLAVVPEQVSGTDVMAAFATMNSAVADLAVAADAARRARRHVDNIEDFVATGATTTAMTVDATVTSNTASGTVESGQITATVLP